jgi:hypothetical protein
MKDPQAEPAYIDVTPISVISMLHGVRVLFTQTNMTLDVFQEETASVGP